MAFLSFCPREADFFLSIYTALLSRFFLLFAQGVHGAYRFDGGRLEHIGSLYQLALHRTSQFGQRGFAVVQFS